MNELNARAIHTFLQGTTVRHKATGGVAVVGEHETTADGRVIFTLYKDGGHPTSVRVRAGRLLADYEVVK